MKEWWLHSKMAFTALPPAADRTNVTEFPLLRRDLKAKVSSDPTDAAPRRTGFHPA
jgi:hypothetical protein